MILFVIFDKTSRLLFVLVGMGGFFTGGACAPLKLPLFDTTDFLYVRKTRLLACFVYPLQGRTGEPPKKEQRKSFLCSLPHGICFIIYYL